ncbi:hypothetical protein [Mycoplasmopsis bovis]|nr:hypothetical protein HYE34_03720 [Mycoplasmopsis bovis]
MLFSITVDFIKYIELTGVAIVIESAFLILVASIDAEPKYSSYGIP